LIPFNPHDYQIDLVSRMEANRHLILTKFRQGGFDTTTVLYGLWKCLTADKDMPAKMLYLCKTDRDCMYMKGIAAIGSACFPAECLTESPASYLKFSNGSSMCFMTPESVVGMDFTHLFVSEAAFIKDMDTHWSTLYLQATFGKTVVYSTVNLNIKNWFKETYRDALVGKNNFDVVHYDYRTNPEFQSPEWETGMRKNLSETAWRSEYLQEFVGTGMSGVQLNAGYGDFFEMNDCNNYKSKMSFNDKNNDINFYGQTVVNNQTASEVPFVVKASPSQTGNLAEFQDASGKVLVSIDANGKIKSYADESVLKCKFKGKIQEAVPFNKGRGVGNLKLMDDAMVVYNTGRSGKDESAEVINRIKLQKLEDLKLQVLAQNPCGLMIKNEDKKCGIQATPTTELGRARRRKEILERVASLLEEYQKLV
jgi:hypothetical protein